MVAWKCLVACLFFNESQQPTCPQVRQRRRCTHLSPVFRQSSQPRACGVTSRIWLRCVHDVTISLFLPFIQQKHMFSFGRAGQFMTFNTLIRLTLFIEPCINCSSCDDVHGVLTSLYNVTRTYASSSSHGTQSHRNFIENSACPVLQVRARISYRKQKQTEQLDTAQSAFASGTNW